MKENLVDFSDPERVIVSFGSQREALIDGIRHNLLTVTVKLCAQGIIPKETYEKASNEMHTPTIRTMEVLDAVESKMRIQPSIFTKFIHILESEPFLHTLADLLIKSYSKWSIKF